MTVQITREVRPEGFSDMEAWMARGQVLAAGFPGYLGSGLVRATADSGTWHVLYRFADPELLDAWERSEARAEWTAQFAHHVQATRALRRTGIEGWFDAPARTEAGDQVPAAPAPPRWKQMIVIFTGFFPMSLLGNWVVSLLAPDSWPLVLRVLATIVLVMPPMVYVVLPGLTSLFRPWLERGARRGPEGG